MMVFDGLLTVGILVLAGAAVASRDAYRAVVLFIALGALTALAWARLAAPDVALAEAAIGAGLTGALLLGAVRRERVGEADGPCRPRGLRAWLGALPFVALAGVLGWVVARMPGAEGLTAAVAAELERSGVSNPVTAVLLNFRAYDTLLELAVLLVALLGVWALGPARPAPAPAGPMLRQLRDVLLPLLVLTAGYLLWAGAHAPGGAFQAGALLAAAGVLLRIGGRADAGLPRGTALRALAVAGVAVFLAVGLAVMAAGGPFLDYPVALAGGLILLIEAAATLAIGATLAALYVGGEHPGDRHAQTRAEETSE
jgi:multisubunit Na+/H+ antiporter MnhB subunit